jgi:hypothetical protein
LSCINFPNVIKLLEGAFSLVGEGGANEIRADEGLLLAERKPLTRLYLASLDFATLSHKGRGCDPATINVRVMPGHDEDYAK